MQWELDWIDRNMLRYTSPEHAEAVKRNIEKRYLILQLRAQLDQQDKGRKQDAEGK